MECLDAWCVGWSTALAELFMSARSFWSVILSDEVAVATEEPKEPFGRQAIPDLRLCHESTAQRPAAIGVLRLATLAQDDTVQV